MYRVSDRAIFDEDGEDLLGQCNNIEQEIIINLRQHRTMEAVRTTWYHELVHAVLYTYGLDSHNLSDDFQSENFVEQLGTGLHILIQDNPGVFNV